MLGRTVENHPGAYRSVSAAASGDPRARLLAFAVLFAGTMFAVDSIGAMAVVLGYVCVLHVGAGGAPRGSLRHIRRLVPLVVLVVALNGWVTEGVPALSVGGRTVLSREGLELGAFFSVRLAVLYLAMVVLVETTPPEDLAAAVSALVRGVSPALARRLAFHAFVSTSFVPLFADEFRRIRIAQSFRGGSLSGGFLERIGAVRLVIVPLILSAIHRSGQLAMVVEVRGLEDRLGATLAPVDRSVRDVMLPAVTFAVVVAASVWWR